MYSEIALLSCILDARALRRVLHVPRASGIVTEKPADGDLKTDVYAAPSAKLWQCGHNDYEHAWQALHNEDRWH